MINLRNPGSAVAPVANAKKPFCFTITDDEGDHLFRARSDEEMQEWIDDIQCVSIYSSPKVAVFVAPFFFLFFVGLHVLFAPLQVFLSSMINPCKNSIVRHHLA
jgi:hypothetical protein